MRKLIILLIFGAGIILVERSFAQNPVIKDISWDGGKGSLSYGLSEDALIKIRVGRISGPVYQTLVNLEQRKAGQCQEPWNGKDVSGFIDFTKYGELHFCVDSKPDLEKDLELLVHLPAGSSSKPGVISVKAQLSLNIDLEPVKRQGFEKHGFEVRIFVDGDLIKVDNARQFPYLLNLDLRPVAAGEHLLSLNIWPLPERSRVAYKNLLISLEKTEQPMANPGQQKVFSSALAFCQQEDGYWQVYITDLNGLGAQKLTASPVDKSSPAFAPDGKKVAYVTNSGELWIFMRQNNQEQKISLSFKCDQPRFSPDGKKIVFISYQDLYHGDTELWTVNIEDGALEKLISRPWLQYNPTFSPDGNFIVFVDGPELYGQEIRKLNVKTKDITQLTDNGPYDYEREPCFSADGENIYYSSNQDGNYDIWVMDKFGQNPRNLTKAPADERAPQVSTDGKRIYFLSDQSGSMQVWRMDINGINPAQITNAKTDLGHLSLCEVK